MCWKVILRVRERKQQVQRQVQYVSNREWAISTISSAPSVLRKKLVATAHDSISCWLWLHGKRFKTAQHVSRLSHLCSGLFHRYLSTAAILYLRHAKSGSGSGRCSIAAACQAPLLRRRHTVTLAMHQHRACRAGC
jgi:hypothetical protein